MMVKFILSLLLLAAATVVCSAEFEVRGQLLVGFLKTEAEIAAEMGGVSSSSSSSSSSSVDGGPDMDDKICTPDDIENILHQVYMKVFEYYGVPAQEAGNPANYVNMVNLEIDLEFIKSHCAADSASQSHSAASFGLSKLSNGCPGARVHCPATDETSGGRRDLLEQPKPQRERILPVCDVSSCPFGHPYWFMLPECNCYSRRRNLSLRGGEGEETKLVTYPDGSSRRLTTSEIKTLSDLTQEGIALCMELDVSKCVTCSRFTVMAM